MVGETTAKEMKEMGTDLFNLSKSRNRTAKSAEQFNTR
jgi:hypothetical protein